MHHMAGHPNVIQIVETCEDAVAVHVIMELYAGGELFDRIIQRGHYTRMVVELARLIVGVVDACHSLGVTHRDLKPENFLFINHEEQSPLKTIDFGLSVFFRPGEMTVGGTLSFSARCQGIGSRCEMLAELSRREKAATIKPDPDLDIYIKTTSVTAEFNTNDALVSLFSSLSRH